METTGSGVGMVNLVLAMIAVELGEQTEEQAIDGLMAQMREPRIDNPYWPGHPATRRDRW